MMIENKQPGFTLIEMLLYIALSSIMLLALTQFFGLALSIRVKAQSVAEIEQQGAVVMKLMTQIIRNASAITAPTAGAASSSLTVTVPATAKSPTIFDLSNGILRVKEGASSTINLTDNRVAVSNLTFSNLSGTAERGTVRIRFTLSRINASSTNEYDYTQDFIGSATLR